MTVTDPIPREQRLYRLEDNPAMAANMTTLSRKPNQRRRLSAHSISFASAVLMLCTLFGAASSEAQVYSYGGPAITSFSVSGNNVAISCIGPIPKPITNYFGPLPFAEWTRIVPSNYSTNVTIGKEATNLIFAAFFLSGFDTVTQYYSVVGLTRLSVPPGDSLLVNPFSRGGNTISELLPAAPEGTTIFKPTATGFVSSTYFDSWSQPNLALSPGEAFILRNRSETNFLMTFWGDASEGAFTENIPAGRSLCGMIGPWSGRLDTDLGYVPEQNDTVLLQDHLSSGNASLNPYFFDGSSWFNVSTGNSQEPIIPPGQSFLIKKSSPTNWSWVQESLNPDSISVAVPSLDNMPAQINFSTYNSTPGLGRVYLCGGKTPADSSYLGQLYAGTNSSETDLMAVGHPVNFFSGTLAGYLVGGLVTIPNTAAGQAIYVQLRVWPGTAGESYEAALANHVATGKSAVFSPAGYSDYSPPDANAFPSFAVECPPLIATKDNSFGFTSGKFGFDAAGAPGETMILEVSTNMHDWFPIQTNTIDPSGSPLYFSDPDSSSVGGRYYRVLEMP